MRTTTMTNFDPWHPAQPSPLGAGPLLPAVTTDHCYGPLVGGGPDAPIQHLDHGASAATLLTVERALCRCTEDMAAIHRGPGYLSRECTKIYEETRAVVAEMAGAPPGSCVILTSGSTTGALNILSHVLGDPKDPAEVIGGAENHHANILPWDRCNYTRVPVPHSPEEMFDNHEKALLRLPRHKRKFLTITGAGNVTGEMPPLRAFADLGRSYDAPLIVDAAQLVAHHPVNMTRDGVAALVFGGHKLGGTSAALGALVVPSDWMTNRAPLIRGGGAVDFVHPTGVQWSADPTVRHEAGSPNVPGAIALGVACLTHLQAGMHHIARHEAQLLQYAYAGLQKIPGLQIYHLWPWEHPRVGVLTFNVDRYPHGLLAEILSCEYGIATRAGCFCAHQLVSELLKVPTGQAKKMMADEAGSHRYVGAVRITIGNGVTTDTLEALFAALRRITSIGPQFTYKSSHNGAHYWPVNDDRPRRLTYERLMAC